MARLRIRIELNRGGVGVPLHKLASVVEQAQKFFHMLAEDVHVDQSTGEWLGFDFDHESLNFTAEFVGPVTQEQVDAFHAAFDGTTSLRRTTIAQFASITEAIGEDELIGFGLYLKDQTEEPAEWRCLSRRDALRISEEMQLLLGASETDQDSRLPAIANSSSVARIFAERERGAEPAAKWTALVREVEANLDRRITRVEQAIEDQSGLIGDLHTKSSATEDSVRRLLGAVEGFFAQTTRQLEALTGPAPALTSAPEEEAAQTPAPMAAKAAAEPLAELLAEPLAEPLAEESLVMRAAAGVYAAAASRAAALGQSPAPDSPAGPAFAPEPREDPVWRRPQELAQPQRRNWQVAMGAALLAMGVIFLSTWVWQNFSTDGPPRVTAATATTGSAVGSVVPAAATSPATPAANSAPAAAAAAAAAPAPTATGPARAATASGGRAGGLRLQASELTWVAIRDAEGRTTMARLFNPGDEQSLEIANGTRLRVGNAGGLKVYLNGQAVAPLGERGQVREMIFRDGGYNMVATQP